MKTVVIILCSLVLIGSVALADKYDRWHTFTSTKMVRYVDYFDDTVQVVTSGGWLKVNPVTLEAVKTVNTDGLGTNNLYHIIQDTNEDVWLAGFGRLIKAYDGNIMPFMFYDRDDNLLTLYSIADDEEQLWIGTSAGLARFSKINDGGQIEDFYFRFGNLPSEPIVNDVLLLGDTIWIATSGGLAVADKSDPNLLKSFANWQSIRPTDYMDVTFDSVISLALYEGYLHLGLVGGAYQMEINGNDTAFVRLNTRANISVRHLNVQGDTLTVYSRGGYFIYDGMTMTWNYTPTIPDYEFTSGFFVDGVHWLGDYLSGLYFGSDSDYVSFNDGGLPGNYVTSLTFLDDDRLAATFNREGLALYDGLEWQPVTLSSNVEGLRASLIDDSGRLWVGSWGGGLYLVEGDSVINFIEGNSALHGVPDASWFVVVNDLDIDTDHLFVINYYPSDLNTVAAVDLNDHTRWTSFGFSDGLPGDFLFSIAAYDDVFVTATSDNGVFYYYYGSDPFEKSDDSVINLTEENSWLGSDQVNEVTFDHHGTLWAATNLGLSQYDRGIDRFINIELPEGFGPRVDKTAFDGRGNIWLGTLNGLGRFDAGTGSFDIFTTVNSGLPDNEITALRVDPETLDLWVGTRRGMARFRSEFAAPAADIAEVIAFPNPFIIRTGFEELSFNYARPATVSIYTVGGELVWENDINVPWTGHNQSGRETAPGVYLFLLTAEDGAVGKGKILLIRE
jgi:hypothetical protein